MDFGSLIGTVEGATFDTVRIESNVFPSIPISLKPPDPSAGGGIGGTILGIIRPSFVVSGAAGTQRFSPYGDPSAGVGWLPLGGVVLGLVVLGVIIGRVSA